MSGSVAAVIGIAIVLIVLTWLSAFKTIRISRWEQGALFIDGGFDRMLAPGRHTVRRLGRQLFVTRVSLSPNYLGVGPVDAITLDGLPVRLNATVVYRIVDAEQSLQTPTAPAVQLAVSQSLLKLAAQEKLEALLARVESYDDRLLAMSEFPAELIDLQFVVLGTVVLPPELRRMLTEVERARLEGLAALERARGEHAALRSLANAARLLKDNPDLMNLRLLQAVGAGGKGATLVLGEGALKSLRPD